MQARKNNSEVISKKDKQEREGGLMVEAVKKVQGFSQEYKDSYWDDMYDKAEHDYVTNMRGERETGIKIGEARGKLLGLSEGKLEIARNLLKMGIDKEMVKEASKLTEEELNSLMN